MWVQSLGGEDPLEEAMATHSSILAWRIPWTEAWCATIHRSQTQLKRLSRAAGVFLKNEDSLKYSSNVFFLLNDSFLVVIKWCMESCSSHQEHQFMILLDTSWETS